MTKELEEINQVENWVKNSDRFNETDRKEWLDHLANKRTDEEARIAAEEKNKPASEADMEKVMDLLMPEFRNIQLGKEQPKSTEDKFLDEVFKFL